MEEKIIIETPEEEVVVEGTKEKKDWMLPASILISALVISVALVYNTGKKDLSAGQPVVQGNEQAGSPKNVKPFSANEHVLGNPNAPVKLILFSDFECPFCKTFHEDTVRKIATDYDGKVAIAFRQFPIHSQSGKEAIASECVASLGGNDKFWAFVDEIFAITPSNDGLDLSELPKIAEKVGVNVNDFNACLTSGKFDAKITADMQDAKVAGLQGTPYTIVIAPSGDAIPISGAYPYATVKQTIDQALKLQK